MKKIVPAGHLGKDLSGKMHEAETESDLEKSLQSLLSEEIFVEPRSGSIEEAHALLLKYAGHPILFRAGRFLSHVYAQSPHKVITYDLDLPIGYLGMHLPEDKILVNVGACSHFYGYGANGVIVNCGTCRGGMGMYARGLVVKAGDARGGFANESRGIAIALNAPEEYPHIQNGKLIRHDVLWEGLRHRLEEFVALCKGPVETIYEVYGENPAAAIKENIRAEIERYERETMGWSDW